MYQSVNTLSQQDRMRLQGAETEIIGVLAHYGFWRPSHESRMVPALVDIKAAMQDTILGQREDT